MMKTVSYHHTPAQKPLVSKTLVQLLRENAHKNPEKTALIFRDNHGKRETVSFNEWCTTMETLATALIKLGIESGEKVGILLPNCLEFAMIQFGLNQAGIIPVFLSPTTTKKDFYALIDQFNLKGICLYVDQSGATRDILSFAVQYAQGEESRLQEKMRFPVINVSDREFIGTVHYRSLITTTEVDEELLHEREKTFDFESTAMIFLTSGSTGVPKGIGASHMYMAFTADVLYGEPDGIHYVDRPIVHLGGNWLVCAAATVGNTTGKLMCLCLFYGNSIP